MSWRMIIPLAILLAAGCGGESDPAQQATTVPTGELATSEPTDALTALDIEESNLHLATREAAIGGEVVLTGSGWTNRPGHPVKFVLLTEEQVEEVRAFRDFAPRYYEDEAASLGERVPADDGSVRLEFLLAESYVTPSGEQIRIEPGEELWFAAYHVGGGFFSPRVGSLTVLPQER